MPSRLLLSIAEASARHPTERKLLVCRDRAEGRELLRALARREGGWIGWESATLRDLAGEMATVALEARGRRILDDVEIAALVDVALDATLERRRAGSVFAPLADGAGFRQALVDAIADLRLAGVDAERLHGAAPASTRRQELADVYRAYLAELEARGGADVASVFAAAVTRFAEEWPLLGARTFVVPGLRRRGLPGVLLERILAAGAERLAGDRVHGAGCPEGLLAPPDDPPSARRGPSLAGRLDLLFQENGGTPDAGPAESPLSYLHDPAAAPPSACSVEVDLFHASSPATELREALRRVVRDGFRWDEVEIAATDPVTYGTALDALSAPSGIPVTFGVGLPLERSRVGRLTRTYLEWVERGFQARPLAEALARGELRPPRVDDERPSGAALARRLRELRIGWGRDRYAAALTSLRQREAARAAARHDREEGDLQVGDAEALRREVETRSLEALLRELVGAMPEGVSDDGLRSGDRTVSPAAVARGARRFLRLFRARPGTEEGEALERVRERLERVAQVSLRTTTLAGALAELRSRLRLRIPRPGTRGPLPWSSAAGALHLTDVLHAGRSDRPCTFVVGLDAERAAAGPTQDALLPDADRELLRAGGPGPAPGLATSSERAEERRWEIAAALASLRGRVVLSYAGWEAATGSGLAPAPLLVQALRIAERRPDATFEHLAARLRAPVSRVPRDGGVLDAGDAWLAAVAPGDTPREATGLVRSAFPLLDAGLAADAARSGAALTAFHGFLPEVDAVSDRLRTGRPFSPSELQLVGRCPLAWLYRYGLGLRKVEEPDYDPSRWLTPLERGDLLHRVYDRFGRELTTRGIALEHVAAEELLESVLSAELARADAAVPAPSAMARAVEVAELHRDVRLFLAMERESAPGWRWFELAFGRGGEPPALVALPDGRALPVHGKVDRVDELPDERLRVVDYKTGKPDSFDKTSRAPFDGGRQIQPGIYVRAVEAVLGRPVAAFEYRLPTERGQQRIEPVDPADVAATLEVAARLVEALESGRFLATTEPGDCRFCDFAWICRVSRSAWKLTSPRAEWSRVHADLPEYALMNRLREKP